MPRKIFEKIGTLLRKISGKAESEILSERVVTESALKFLKKLEKGGYYGFEGRGKRWGVYKIAGTEDVGHFTVFRPPLQKKGTVFERHYIGLEGIKQAMLMTGRTKPTKKFKSYEELIKWVQEE